MMAACVYVYIRACMFFENQLPVRAKPVPVGFWIFHCSRSPVRAKERPLEKWHWKGNTSERFQNVPELLFDKCFSVSQAFLNSM